MISHSPAETAALAARLAPGLRPGDVVVLTGELGSGKTEFVRGLAVVLGHQESDVSSPSFTVVNEYPGEKPLYHFDLYRLDNISQLREVGWDDYLVRGGLVVVEWGEKARALLPHQYYQITFEIVDDQCRQIDVEVVDA